ncbi:MAG: hypothetical protein WCS85_00705 [Candidatus Peribacteraceae bacterium]|jgi:hypothetical protein
MKPQESWKEFVKRKGLKEQKEIKMKDISRKGKHIFLREAFTFQMQHNHPNKYFTIERLKYLRFEGYRPDISNPSSAKAGSIEYRFCYYIVGKNGNMDGKWTWGQFCPMIPTKDYKRLMQKAKDDCVIY